MKTAKEIEKMADEYASEIDRGGTAYHIGLMRGFIDGYRNGQSNPKIKQLEWLDDNFPYRGCSVFVDYIISNKIGSRYTVILDIGTGIRINSFKTIDEAKAAAQADFEKRIKECLE